MIIIVTIGVLLGVSVFLLLEKNMIRQVFGLVLLSSTVNLVILICGRIESSHPPFVGDAVSITANPLPQALILTAIVIGFGLLAFLCALLKKVLN